MNEYKAEVSDISIITFKIKWTFVPTSITNNCIMDTFGTSNVFNAHMDRFKWIEIGHFGKYYTLDIIGMSRPSPDKEYNLLPHVSTTSGQQ